MIQESEGLPVVLGTAWKQGWNVSAETVESLPYPPPRTPTHLVVQVSIPVVPRLREGQANAPPFSDADKVKLSPIRLTWIFALIF